MAKASSQSSNRSDPKSNKSLAIRTILKKMPNAKGSEIVAAVKKEFGHDVKINMVYMVKTKLNMKSARKRKGSAPAAAERAGSLDSAEKWVTAIRLGRDLLEATGSVSNAISLLKALDR